MTKLPANPSHRAGIAAICQQFVVFAEPTSPRVAGAEDFKIETDQHGLLYDNSAGAP